MGMAIGRDGPAHGTPAIGDAAAGQQRLVIAQRRRPKTRLSCSGMRTPTAAPAAHCATPHWLATKTTCSWSPNAAQVLLDPLPLLIAALHRLEGEVAIVAHADGTPSGVMLLPRAALHYIANFGFVDLKEQALPLIARHFNVRVLRRSRPTGLPVRSAAGYCAALRQYHRRRAGLPIGADLIGENWTSAFSIVEPGAVVAPGAQLHDAIVLNGARVEAGATAVRCVIGPGGVVRRGQTVVDELIWTPAEGDEKRRAA